MKHDRASELRAIAEGRLLLNVRNGVTVSRSMLAMIADEIDALRAAPLTPAEAGGLVERLRSVVEISEPLEAENCVEAWNWLVKQAHEAASALTAERAAHAETKRERDEATEALDLISHMHDGNPPLPLADMPELDYARRTISTMRREARDAARRVREGGGANG